jgi:hypothetical protein
VKALTASLDNRPGCQEGLIPLKNSCLIEVHGADSIPTSGGRIGDDGTEAGSSGCLTISCGNRASSMEVSTMFPVGRFGAHDQRSRIGPPEGRDQAVGPALP